jgi:2-succinyl-6-hydroxy-2,4-cyclohexadiene-1-carboxylate synthase
MEIFEINNEEYAVYIYQRKQHLPWLLMLHGFLGDHRVCNHLIDDLSSFSNPVTVDLLGHGNSSKPDDPNRYHEDQQIHDVRQLVTQLDISAAFLFGYSMGGRLALKTAVTYPQKFRGLLLESTTCGITDSPKRKERKKMDAQWAKSIQEDFEHFLYGWKKLELFQSPLPITKSLSENYHQIQSDQSPSALAASLHGFGTGSMTPVCNDLKTLDLPVLLLAGSADQKYQRINHYLVNQFPNATFSSIEAAHRTHLDNPTAFINAIKYYFRNYI